MSCEFWTGLIGALIGALTGLGAVYLSHLLANGPQQKLDKSRKAILLSMLQGDGWRKIETLSGVIGADHETTKRLLFDLVARGSESVKDVWALTSKHPLPMKD